MANDAPLSYQTTMPEYPDVSYEAFAQRHGTNTRLGHALEDFFTGQPNYQTWRTNLLDEYNARMSAYNTWLQTGAGIRASAESGGYNPSYFDGGQASASPLSYQDVAPQSGFSQMAQGVSGVLQLVSAIQNWKLMSVQIAGQVLKNEEQEIKNKYAEEWLYGRNQGQVFKNEGLGFDADFKQMRNEAQLYPIYEDHPELWLGGVFSPYGRMSYDLRGANKGFSYQRAYHDIEAVKAAVNLRKEQGALLKLSQKEKKFYTDSIQSVYLQFLQGQLKLVNGQVDFQPIEQKLRKQAIQWGIGLNAANTVINGVKTAVQLLTPAGAAANALPGVPSWGNLPNQSQSWGSGWDVTTGAWINPYNGYQ